MYTQPLSKELREKAENELNEISSQVEENLEHIRNWLVKQPHLNARTDDLLLLNFLRGCKFNLQRTKEKLDFFYTIRSITPECFENRDPFLPEIQEFLKQGILLPLESTDNPIILVRWKNFEKKKLNFKTFVKVCFMVFDITLNENNSYIITGIQVINDFDGFPINFLHDLTPSLCKNMFLTAQKAYPLRIKGTYVINAISYFKVILSFCKPFIGKKLRERMHIYNKNELSKLYKHIPQSALPDQYGGEAGSIDEIQDKLKKKIESYRNWFLEDSRYRCDESKRPVKPKTSADMYGIEDNFRKLEID